ncbi:Xaa-Pro peptidase family protein [Microaerobacter geothermalis]|uniref:M24 family metallopeptidase n=1 Tax=Microaerobacter geothermalis TaxID=674972 RepID=UPI001F4110F7|nr:Xaa-Pro peptidase family protein [Microaerobacter geothermalis]MCF6092623.1 Xaa-Pro peptidase family protein [Microaerobacter geothermalis]
MDLISHLHLVPKGEIDARIAAMQKYLNKLEIDAAFLTQNVDIFYFSGTMQTSLLYIPASGEPILYVRKSVLRAEREASVRVEEMGSLRKLPERLIQSFGKAKRIGMDLDVLPYKLAERYKNLFPDAEVMDISMSIREIRSIKSPYELGMIQKAAIIEDKAIQHFLSIVHPGMKEIEAAAEVEKVLRQQGHIGFNRMRAYNQELLYGVIATGSSASIPTYFDGPAGGLGLSPANPTTAGWQELKENEPIILDFCTCYEGYNVDQTRIVVIGQLDRELEKAYEISMNILKWTEQAAKPGVSWESLYLDSLKIVEDAGLSEHYMGFGKDQVRFLGHGVGLEVDELPILAKGFSHPLKENMVIAVEPKFTFPGKGVVGIENTYVVTQGGLKSLCVTPEELLNPNKL